MERKKEIFIEILRLLACILVILYHSRYQIYEFISGGGNVSILGNYCLNACFVIGRLAVPLFFIISGYFSFPIKDNTFTFFKKRLTRIIYPLIIWLVIYTLCFSSPKSMIYDLAHATQAPHLWYLYALIGITLLIPMGSSFISNATKQELQLYILIWSLTLIFNGNFFDEFLTFKTDHNGMLFTNPITALISFYGYFGYILVGAYLRRFEVGKLFPIILMCSGCILVLILLAFGISMDKIIAYCSISNLFISVSIFILTKRLFEKLTINDSTYKFICRLGGLTFGIYLTHWLFFKLLYIFPQTETWNCLVSSSIVFIISAIATYLISKTTVKKYIIG